MDSMNDDELNPPPELAVLALALTCPICKEVVDGPVSSQCGHVFCSACIRASLDFNHSHNQKQTCPACRKDCNPNELRRVDAMRMAAQALPAAMAAVEALRCSSQAAEQRAAAAELELAELRAAPSRYAAANRRAAPIVSAEAPSGALAEDVARGSSRNAGKGAAARVAEVSGGGARLAGRDMDEGDDGVEAVAAVEHWGVSRGPGGGKRPTGHRNKRTRRSGGGGGGARGESTPLGSGGGGDEGGSPWSVGDGEGEGSEDDDGDDEDYNPSPNDSGGRGDAKSGRRHSAAQTAPGRKRLRGGGRTPAALPVPEPRGEGKRDCGAAAGGSGRPGPDARVGARPSGAYGGPTGPGAAGGPGAEGTGECPMCKSRYPLAQLQAHAEMCLTRMGLGGGGGGRGRAAVAAVGHRAVGPQAAGSALGPVAAPAAAAKSRLGTVEVLEEKAPTEVRIPPARSWHQLKDKAAKKVMTDCKLPVQGDKQEWAERYNRYRSFLQAERDKCTSQSMDQLLRAFLQRERQVEAGRRQPAVAPSWMLGQIRNTTDQMNAVRRSASTAPAQGYGPDQAQPPDASADPAQAQKPTTAQAALPARPWAPEPDQAPSASTAPGPEPASGPSTATFECVTRVPASGFGAASALPGAQTVAGAAPAQPQSGFGGATCAGGGFGAAAFVATATTPNAKGVAPAEGTSAGMYEQPRNGGGGGSAPRIAAAADVAKAEGGAPLERIADDVITIDDSEEEERQALGTTDGGTGDPAGHTGAPPRAQLGGTRLQRLESQQEHDWGWQGEEDWAGRGPGNGLPLADLRQQGGGIAPQNRGQHDGLVGGQPTGRLVLAEALVSDACAGVDMDVWVGVSQLGGQPRVGECGGARDPMAVDGDAAVGGRNGSGLYGGGGVNNDLLPYSGSESSSSGGGDDDWNSIAAGHHHHHHQGLQGGGTPQAGATRHSTPLQRPTPREPRGTTARRASAVTPASVAAAPGGPGPASSRGGGGGADGGTALWRGLLQMQPLATGLSDISNGTPGQRLAGLTPVLGIKSAFRSVRDGVGEQKQQYAE